MCITQANSEICLHSFNNTFYVSAVHKHNKNDYDSYLSVVTDYKS